MSLDKFNDKQKEAFESGWRVGATTVYYEILRLRNRCEWPEDIEEAIDEWLDDWKNGRRFIK